VSSIFRSVATKNPAHSMEALAWYFSQFKKGGRRSEGRNSSTERNPSSERRSRSRTLVTGLRWAVGTMLQACAQNPFRSPSLPAEGRLGEEALSPLLTQSAFRRFGFRK